MRSKFAVRKGFADRVGLIAGVMLIVVLLLLLALNVSVLFGEGLPSLFGTGFYLSYDETDLGASKLLAVDGGKPSVGDFAVYKHGKGYRTGYVEHVKAQDGENFYVITTAENSVSVMPEGLLYGKVSGEIDGVGKLIAFFGKYKLAFIILALMVSAVEGLDIFLNLQKCKKHGLLQ